MGSGESADIFDVLDSDHRALLELVTAASAITDGEPSPSRCEQHVMAGVRHFVAEEQYLLPLVRAHLVEGESMSSAAFEEHRTVENKLRRLEDLEQTPARVRPILADVEAAIRRHVASQHDQLFPALRERCDSARLQALGDEVIGSEQLAPTRPRIVHAESPLVNKVVSLIAGYVDQVRDAYAHRGVDNPHGSDARSGEVSE
jgi:hypothetical protein